MDFVALIASIPATFWGVIIGSLFTVIGVTITNTSNTRRLRLQHEHERELNTHNRDLNMRREVYLGAFEAIATGMSMVGNFSELEVPFQELMRDVHGQVRRHRQGHHGGPGGDHPGRHRLRAGADAASSCPCSAAP